MSRLTIEVSSDQHQQIKVMAAMQGKSIKDYIIAKLFRTDDEIAEQAAWENLKTELNSRLDDAKENGVSPLTVKEVTENALRALSKN